MIFQRNNRLMVMLAILLIFSFIVVGCGADTVEDVPIDAPENDVATSEDEGPEGGEVTIGTKNFTESILLANIFSVLIEENTNMTANVQELGGTMVAFEALRNNDIQLYPEYTGTGYINMLEKTEILTAEETYEIVQSEFQERWSLEWMQPLGFNNTYTLALRQTMIDDLDLNTFSDLLEHDQDLTFGGTTEFVERQDGLPGLVDAYNFEFGNVVDLDPGLMYTAVQSEDVDIISAFATDGRIPAYNLGILEDDLSFFPPYFAAPLIRSDVLEQYPQLEILNTLHNMIDDETMAELNFRVDEMGETEEAVARDFLSSAGLI
ncbi:osmoprotectant transport system substrate-binding protein [Tindallia magadiensis]|uniref:Osmoprotectant transport system substrate-binding protein n=1 Tax=Tindallia magadiensis TaxID=69895 RepID=A0A1I3AYC8_9FIRM|nr:glycine betaine ABC transporter substrate-binding protein [Tindallia magadiensis]SFH55053.1 osmoprotectant transport system substrate-binding protein [Tindallia magadiensis]